MTQVTDESGPPIIVTSPDAERERDELQRTWMRRPGLIGFIISTNHKDIGIRFVVTAFIFFLIAGTLAVFMRIQLAVPDNTLLGPDLYNQFFTTHGTIMMFLFAVPVMEGMGLYLVPLMIGTRNVAFPRLMAFSYWTYLIGGGAIVIALLLNTGPDMGWFAYVPLSGPDYGIGHRADFWSQMVTMVEIASMAGAIDILATIFKLRAPGMSLNRLPLFCWAEIVMSFMVLFAMPAVSLGSTLLSADRLTRVNTHIFNPAEGGDALLWQHLFWFFAHPEVYIIFIPATGFISAMLPAFTRRKIFGYTALVLSMLATAFIGFGVWVHHMFVTPIPDLGQAMFSGASMLITIPNAVQIFCWAAAIWGGRVWLRTPMLFILGFFAIFILGGLTGVMLASVSLDQQAHDTFFIVAHLHYVLIGGAIFPLFGAWHYWYPKVTGRMTSERLGFWSFALLFVGFNLTFYPMHHLGLGGMTRRIYTYNAETGWGPLNMLATIGGVTMGMGILVMMWNFLRARWIGMPAGPNPWEAGTMEWATSSPPPRYNWQLLPTCEGREPVWENRPDAAVVVGLARHKREVLATTLLDAAPEHRYEMAGDSFWPLLTAVGVAILLFGGGIFHPKWVIWGLAVMCVGLAAWFWVSGLRSYNLRRGLTAPAID